MTTVVSSDGTRIAYEMHGEGPPIILVGGALCDRNATRPLAERLARHFSVLNYDRRGRGDSDHGSAYAVEREIEDLAALVDNAGDSASVYGHSSGAGLALRAAAHGVPIRRLILHEPPYGPDDEESTRSARELAESVREALAKGHRARAIELFLSGTGMPPEAVARMSAEPGLQALAPTLLHDFEVMGEFQGGAIPEARVRSVRIPTMVLAGGASPSFFLATAARIAELLPHGQYTILEDQDHGAPAEVVARVVADFVSTRQQTAGVP